MHLKNASYTTSTISDIKHIDCMKWCTVSNSVLLEATQ